MYQRIMLKYQDVMLKYEHVMLKHHYVMLKYQYTCNAQIPSYYKDYLQKTAGAFHTHIHVHVHCTYDKDYYIDTFINVNDFCRWFSNLIGGYPLLRKIKTLCKAPNDRTLEIKKIFFIC